MTRADVESWTLDPLTAITSRGGLARFVELCDSWLALDANRSPLVVNGIVECPLCGRVLGPIERFPHLVSGGES